jgi:UPF0755 protein
MLRIPAAILLSLGAALAFLLLDAPSRDGWTAKKVIVPKGSALPQIVGHLSKEGVLLHPLVFQGLVIVSGKGKQLHFGEYKFQAPPSAWVIWRKLVDGDVTKSEVTIAEGSTIFDIARILSERELIDAAEFVKAAQAPEVLGRLGIEGPSAEGFLFPDTYVIVKAMTAEDILEAMVRQFRKKLTPEIAKTAKESGLSIRDVVTIASIIEKETGVEEEKPLVSAIIRKRLALGMPLQMDPTVIYGLQRFGSELTKKDLRTPSPYNSYLNKGLPPGPIANPGLSSLRAAVLPADADYLYFVSRNDGSHRFSRTLAEHNRAVALFRKSESEKEE